MPGIQWLGQMQNKQPSQRQQNVSAIAEAISKGTQAYMGTRQQERQYGLQKEELGIKKKAVEVDMAKIDYTKRKELVDLFKEQRDRLPDEQWQVLMSDPTTTELIVSVYGQTGLNAMRALQPKKTRQEDALTAIGKGEPLKGLTMEETKRVAGAMVSPLEAIQSQLGDILGKEKGGGFTAKQPVRPTTPAVSPTTQKDELVTVTNPSGKRVRIRRSQLQDAFTQGYRK